MKKINWQDLINSRCLIINHPFWGEERDEVGNIQEVKILKTTPDGEYVTFEFPNEDINNWEHKSRLEFIEGVNKVSSEFNGKWLITKTSYKGMECWENTVTEVTVLGISLSHQYIKLEYTRTDGTKNILWDKASEIILKYKLED